jgi:hypothetical protein
MQVTNNRTLKLESIAISHLYGVQYNDTAGAYTFVYQICYIWLMMAGLSCNKMQRNV